MVIQKPLLLPQENFHHYSTIYFFHFINSTIFDYLDRLIKNYFGLIFPVTIIILTVLDVASFQ